MRKIHFGLKVLVLPVALFASGCAPGTKYRVHNNTGYDIELTTFRGKKTTIKNRKAAVVEIPVKVQTQVSVWTYRNSHYPFWKHETGFGEIDEATYVFKRSAGGFVLQLQIEKNGNVYILKATEEPPISPLADQPTGFPIKPDNSKINKMSSNKRFNQDAKTAYALYCAC